MENRKSRAWNLLEKLMIKLSILTTLPQVIAAKGRYKYEEVDRLQEKGRKHIFLKYIFDIGFLL